MRLAQNWLVKRARDTTREGAGIPEEQADAAASAFGPAVGRPDSGGDPLAALIADEDDRRLWRAVAALPSGERTAAILFYREDSSVREIAFALGVTAGTVKTLLFRSRRHLRQALGGPSAAEDPR